MLSLGGQVERKPAFGEIRVYMIRNTMVQTSVVQFPEIRKASNRRSDRGSLNNNLLMERLRPASNCPSLRI
jgi:hypothetical protein